MKLALLARVKIDPRRLLKSRWIHDIAHRIITSLRRAQDDPKPIDNPPKP